MVQNNQYLAMRRFIRPLLYSLFRIRGQIPDTAHTLQRDASLYWAASAGNDNLKDLSHWRGYGRWSDDTAWLGIGENNLFSVEQLIVLSGRTRPLGSVLEWGPGGGSNAIALRSRCQFYYGVDISAANLAECGRQLRGCGFSNFHPILIDPTKAQQTMQACRSLPAIDLFLSTACFQHFPSKEFGAMVLQIASSVLADDGLAVIQIRYDDGSKSVRQKYGAYFQNAITFTSYKIEAFWQLLSEKGLMPLAVTLFPETNYATYLAKKRVD